jgi:GNAT superfamily N-acetyltransferase
MLRVRRSDDVLLVTSLNHIIMPEDDLDHHPDDQYWVAWDDKTPVGFAVCRVLEFDKATCYFTRSGVMPTHRGRGLQKRLIRARLRWAKSAGCTSAITYTIQDNPQSYSNLQSCGFKLYQPDYEWVDGCLFWIRHIVQM